MNASQHQPGMLDGMNAVQDKLDVPADDVFAAVSRDKGKGMVATVKSLLDAYGSVPMVGRMPPRSHASATCMVPTESR